MELAGVKMMKTMWMPSTREDWNEFGVVEEFYRSNREGKKILMEAPIKNEDHEAWKSFYLISWGMAQTALEQSLKWKVHKKAVLEAIFLLRLKKDK